MNTLPVLSKLAKTALLIAALCIAVPAAAQNHAVTRITFIVRDQHTGFAIWGATIQATGPDSTMQALQADASGKGVFAAGAGKYQFTFSADGYQTLDTWFEGGTGATLEANIHLEPDSVMDAAEDANQKKNLSAPYVYLRGYVRDADANTPLGGATVTAGDLSTTTNSNGFFTIEMPATVQPATPAHEPGKTAVTVTKPGYIPYTLQNLYTVTAGYHLKIPLTATIAPSGRQRTEREQADVKAHGLYDRTEKDNPYRYNEERAAREQAIETVTAPASIRVGTGCSCTTCSTVQVMSLEAYTESGVDDEWISSWGAASLQAGAVAYRSYGAWYVLHPVASNYDIASTTCNQVWNSDVVTSVRNAAKATAGEVLLKDNAIYRSEYCAETNNSGCGDGYSGTGSTWPCIKDERCAGRTKNGHGRGMCQWGSSFWASDKDHAWILNHYYNPGGVTIQYPTTPPPPVDTTHNTDSLQNGDLMVAPNPVKNMQAGIVYKFNDEAQTGTLLLHDMYGRVVHQQTVSLLPGINRFTVKTAGLKAGIYVITVFSTSKKVSCKIIFL